MSDEQNNDSKWKSRELGALWKRQGRNQNYLTGKIKIGEFGVEKEVKVVIFTNKNKSKNERAPDFIVYESEDVANANQAVTSSEATASAAPVVEQPAEQDSEVPDLLI